MFSKLAIILFCLTLSHPGYGAEELRPKIQSIMARAQTFQGIGYTKDADDIARSITQDLLKPSATRHATPAEAAAMTQAHLEMELYYAFNTEHGSNKIRNHRIVYDFLSDLDKNKMRTKDQKAHLTILTVLSLAAQEFFWNEKSTVADLKKRVLRELRYGLFSQLNHKLDVSNLIVLEEKQLAQIIEEKVDAKLLADLENLLNGFKAKQIGDTYGAIFDELTNQLSKATTETLPVELAQKHINFEKLGFKTKYLSLMDEPLSLKLIEAPSEGDGMCGEHSLFIPTDGACSKIAEGNGRYKILRAILDNPEDSEARRLYLLASDHLDSATFKQLMKTHTKVLSQTQAKLLHDKITAYEELENTKLQAKEKLVADSKQQLITDIAKLPGLAAALNEFKAQLNTPDIFKEWTTAWAIDDQNRTFKNIIDAIMSLRTANPELEKLLPDIVQLDLELQQAQANADTDYKSAQLTALLKKYSTEKALKDFCSLDKHKILVAKIKRINNAIVKAKNKLKNYRKSSKLTGLIPAQEKIVTNSQKELATLEQGDLVNFNKLIELQTAHSEALSEYAATEPNYTLRNEKRAAKYTLIATAIKDFIDVDILPVKPGHKAFTLDNLKEKYGAFITDLCQNICLLIDDTITATLIEQRWDKSNNQATSIDACIGKELALERLVIVESLETLPVELQPAALVEKMINTAMDAELDGWLQSEAVYTQLWATLHNLNIRPVA